MKRKKESEYFFFASAHWFQEPWAGAEHGAKITSGQVRGKSARCTLWTTPTNPSDFELWRLVLYLSSIHFHSAQFVVFIMCIDFSGVTSHIESNPI